MSITLFSWGYWGWGNATKQFVQSVDLAENRRDFRPPIFVEIRILRQGRAKGFVGDAFRDLVGESRYRWMPDLGNLAVAQRLRRMKIKRPEAAADLLDLAIQAAKDRRRVIFFCGCKFPRINGKTWCHRDKAIDLLLAVAKKRHRSISIIEWPGGEPTAVNRPIVVDRILYRSILNGRSNIPFHHERLGEFAGLPWGSILRIECDHEEGTPLSAGPANFAASNANGVWRLPVFLEVEKGHTRTLLAKAAKEWRQKFGLHERRFQG
jgi:hypothetical protein